MRGLNSKRLNSPDLRYAGSPSLRLWRKEGLLGEKEILSSSFWRSQKEGRQAERYRGESSPLFKRLLLKQTYRDFAFRSIWIFLIFFCVSCSSEPQAPVIHVSLVSDRKSVKISGLDNAIVQEIESDSAGGSWQALVPVYHMPADTDLKNYQPVQPGTYHVKDNAVIFVPDTPFVANQKYFVRYYKFDAGAKVTDFVTGRNRPGSLRYSDLEFK
jgi:hypothetical protein